MVVEESRFRRFCGQLSRSSLCMAALQNTFDASWLQGKTLESKNAYLLLAGVDLFNLAQSLLSSSMRPICVSQGLRSQFLQCASNDCKGFGNGSLIENIISRSDATASSERYQNWNNPKTSRRKRQVPYLFIFISDLPL